MANDRVLTGAIAVVKSKGLVVASMKGITYQEQIRRTEVVGLGSIIPKEAPVVGWSASLSCEFMLVKASQSVIQAINRKIDGAIKSRASAGKYSYEDNLLLEYMKGPSSVEVYSIEGQSLDPTTGNIVPKLKLLYTVPEVVIESDSIGLQEGGLGSKSQSYKCLAPAVEI